MKAKAYEEGILLKYGAWQMMLTWKEAEELQQQLFSIMWNGGVWGK